MKILYISLLTIFFTVALFSCNNHNKKAGPSLENNIPDSLIYQVINYIISHKELNPDIKSNILSNKDDVPFLFYFKDDSLALTKLDSIFSKEDISFIFSQRKQFENFIINPKFIRDKEVVPLDSLYGSKYKTYSTISFPLFNIKKDIAIISTSYYCGAFCGHQGTYIYQKKDSDWVLLKVIDKAVY